MRVLRLVVFAVLLGRGASFADETPRTRGPAERLDLSDARVLVSPGWPEALKAFLPEGREPEPLRWPLPEGPVLVVGLPESDRTAAEIGETLGVIEPGTDLGGGYVLSAWRDGKRPIAVLLASDPAALYAARFELEAVPPAEMGRIVAPGDRSREVTTESAKACTCVAPGRRVVHPAFRERALWVRDGAAFEGAVLRAVAAHASHLWIDEAMEGDPEAVDRIRRARRFGIATFVVSTMRPATGSEPAGEGEAPSEAPIDGLVLRNGGWTPDALRVFAMHLAQGPGRLRVVLMASSAADLSEAAAWEPGFEIAADMPATDVLEHATVPVHLIETWNAAANGSVHTIPPSMPRDRDARLGRLAQGLVVPDGPLADAVLEHAFDAGVSVPPDPVDVLLPFVPMDAKGVGDLLRRTGKALRAAAPDLEDASPWVASYAEDLEARGRAWSAYGPEAVVPTVAESPVLDGRLADRAWAFAPHETLERLDVFVVSDGHDLHVGVRGRIADFTDAVLGIDGGVGDPVSLPLEGAMHGDRAGRALRVRTQETAGARTLEARIGHDALGGDACPGRVISLHVARRPKRSDGGDAAAPTVWRVAIGR